MAEDARNVRKKEIKSEELRESGGTIRNGKKPEENISYKTPYAAKIAAMQSLQMLTIYKALGKIRPEG